MLSLSKHLINTDIIALYDVCTWIDMIDNIKGKNNQNI